MIPWELRTTFHLSYKKTVIFILFLCLCVLSSHCHPVCFNCEPVVPGTHNNASMVVRVIVSSSSSSSSSSGDVGVGNRYNGYFPFPSLAMLTTTYRPTSINPTTYHPDLTLPPISRSVRAKTSLTNEDSIFSVFYRAFSERGDNAKSTHPNHPLFFDTQRPSENNVSVNAKVVSVVSHSRSVSASRNEDSASSFRRRKVNPNPVSPTKPPPLPNDQPITEAMTQTPDDQSGQWQEKVWGHPERNWGESERIWGEPVKSESEPEKTWGDKLRVNSEPEKIWGEPEKVWGEPEKVWGKPEKVWTGHIGHQNKRADDHQPPRIYEIPGHTVAEVTHSDDEENQQGKFYELGEDEEAEPQELNLEEPEVRARVMEAQLAARSWELPELNSPVDHSLMSGVEMMAESIQIPQTQNENVNSRQRSKAIENESVNVSERPGKKFGYVLDNNDLRKYRVEQRTPDGSLIIGEYGITTHDNAFLRGVRYTADGTINPRLIHEALMKFLAL